MITIYSLEEKPKIIRKAFLHSPDVLIEARDFYRRNKDMRHHKVVVYNNDRQPMYCLGWTKNKVTNKFTNPRQSKMHLSNFWNYSSADEGLDYSYVDRYRMIIYEKLEEYSCHTARMALAHNPELIVVFTDTNAALFFEESARLFIVETEEELFTEHPELKNLKTLRATAPIFWNPQGLFMSSVPTVEIMTSMYWIKREFYYGPLNPDKTFYLIKQPVKENGLTALVSGVIGVTHLIRRIRPDFIPIVDLGIAGDTNQFAGDSGDDVWGMFFKQLSPYTLAEVYNSQHVILDQNTNVTMNPYLTEFTFSNQRAELRYGDELQYVDEVEHSTEKILCNIFPKEKKRILAVVVRGTDYLLPQIAAFVPHGITAQETLEMAVKYVRERAFDYVFLATEDASVLELFKESELQDRLLYVDQKRYDYQKDNYTKLLWEVYESEDAGDPYERNLRYIAVLEGVVRCDALLANVSCGAVTYSLGRRKEPFEFVDVRKIDNFRN